MSVEKCISSAKSSMKDSCVVGSDACAVLENFRLCY